MRLVLAALALIVGTIPAAAQWVNRPWPGIPRTAEGKPNLTAPAPRGPDGKPDFTGVWNGPNPEPRLDAANAQPWVDDLVRQRLQDYHKGRPSYQCLPSGPEADRFAGWKRILQTPTAMAILNDDLTYRMIFMDGRELEANAAPSWMGYSVGRWDGDTLIVDSFGFNDKTWLSRYGQAHTEALRVRELYRRRDFGHLQVEVTFTDPAAYAKPWGFTAEMALAADTDMLESVCERSSEHWTGSLSDAARAAVTLVPDVLARYVGVYGGTYLGTRRTVEVLLSGGQLIAKVVGIAGVDGGETRPLVPQSETLFEGLGLFYQFIVDDTGVATDVVEIHITGLVQVHAPEVSRVMWIVHNMRWIMLVSGVLTATMVQAVITPDTALQSNFGETVSGPLGRLVVRNWGALIALVGAMLIYGAFNPPQRALVLIVAGASKVVFIALVLSEGTRYLSHQAGVAVAIDSVMVVLFGWYLVAVRSLVARAAAKTTRLSV